MSITNVTTRSAAIRAQKPNGRISRGDRARFLFERGHVHPAGRFGHYRVTSEGDQDKSYRVECGGDVTFCNCLDWSRQYERTHRQAEVQCKHAGAVLLYRAACRAGFQRVA